MLIELIFNERCDRAARNDFMEKDVKINMTW